MTSRFDAVVFDMDGTLLDSMGYWRRINVDFLHERGLEPPEEIRAELLETSSGVCARLYAERYELNMDVHQIMEEYWRRMGEYYQSVIQPKPGAIAYVESLRLSGVRVCVATACPGALAEPALARHGLLEPMEFVVSAPDIQMSKGDPAFYEMVAARLNLPCARCVMFEDMLYAMKGAKAAGMLVYGIADATQRQSEAEIERLCDVYIHDFHELLDDIHR